MATAAEKVTILEAANAALTQQLSDKSEALAQAYTARDLYANKNTALEAELATTKAQRDAAQGEVAGASQMLSELNAELSEAQEKAGATAGKPRTVKHEGITYEVVIPRFSFKGRKYSADDVKEGSDLLAQLNKCCGAGVLVAVAPLEAE